VSPASRHRRLATSHSCSPSVCLSCRVAASTVGAAIPVAERREEDGGSNWWGSARTQLYCMQPRHRDGGEDLLLLLLLVGFVPRCGSRGARRPGAPSVPWTGMREMSSWQAALFARRRHHANGCDLCGISKSTGSYFPVKPSRSTAWAAAGLTGASRRMARIKRAEVEIPLHLFELLARQIPTKSWKKNSNQ
jgi:hypothetical protein